MSGIKSVTVGGIRSYGTGMSVTDGVCTKNTQLRCQMSKNT